MTNEVSVIGSKDLDETIKAFEKIKSLAEYLSNSDAFMEGFKLKDKDGKDIIDEETKRPKVNMADITICLLAGHEMQLNIAGSLLYGKKLNQATYMAAMKGRSIGVDVATAIEKIISIPTKNGYVSYTMVDIISAKLLQGGVSFLPFIKNYAPFYIYHTPSGEELELDKVLDENDDLRPEYSIITISNDINDVKAQLETCKTNNKIPIIKERHGYYSKAKFVRKFPDGRELIHHQRFSTVDAERAGLLPVPVLDTNGKIIDYTKGKDNWNSNTPQMMNNRVISIGGRIIGADLINGIYTREELIDSGIIDEKDAPIIEADVVS